MFNLDNLVSNITGYFEAKIELVKLDIQDRISDIVSGIAHLFVLILVLFLVVLFTGMALGFGLGSLLNNNFLGFLIVAFMFGILLILTTKKVLKTIVDKEIQKTTDKIFNKSQDGK